MLGKEYLTIPGDPLSLTRAWRGVMRRAWGRRGMCEGARKAVEGLGREEREMKKERRKIVGKSHVCILKDTEGLGMERVRGRARIQGSAAWGDFSCTGIDRDTDVVQKTHRTHLSAIPPNIKPLIKKEPTSFFFPPPS